MGRLDANSQPSLFATGVKLGSRPKSDSDVLINGHPFPRRQVRDSAVRTVVQSPIENTLPIEQPRFLPQQVIEGVGRRLSIFYAQNEGHPTVREVTLRKLIEAIESTIETQYATTNSQTQLDAFVNQCFQAIITKHGLDAIAIIPVDLTDRIVERAEHFLAAIAAQRSGKPYPSREAAIAGLALADDGD